VISDLFVQQHHLGVRADRRIPEHFPRVRELVCQRTDGLDIGGVVRDKDTQHSPVANEGDGVYQTGSNAEPTFADRDVHDPIGYGDPSNDAEKRRGLLAPGRERGAQAGTLDADGRTGIAATIVGARRNSFVGTGFAAAHDCDSDN
jgi:hypothetical protein